MAIDNLITITFTKEEQDKINKALSSIEQVINNKVVNLSPEERQQYGKINNNTENWINKVKGYMEQKPELVPFYIKKDEFDKDMNARQVIMPVLNRIASIQESLDDTAKLLSTDIYNTAIAYYRNVKLISMQNVPGTTGIYQDLAAQFPGRGSSVPEQPETPEDTGNQ